MIQPCRGFVILLALASLPAPRAFGQLGGIRAGQGVDSSGFAVGGMSPGEPLLSPEAAETYIIIDGRAELRVRPTEIRMVVAVTGEAETAPKCQEQIAATIARLKAAWSKIGVPSERVVADFIAVLPRYGWDIEKRSGVEVGVEKRVGYRMQTNLHVAVQNDSQAETAVARAFEQGVTDIIGFDYWSRDLDEVKVKAREQAVKAARSKADALLGALLRDQPPVINVQERTAVHYPESLYHTVAGSAEDTMRGGYRREMPLIEAYRPRHTYYRGLSSNSDVQPRELPMNPEISVVSTVRLYFKSPAGGHATKKEEAPKK